MIVDRESGQIVVADQMNRRLVVLVSDLTLKRVLLDEIQGLPFRMCAGRSTGYLFVARAHANSVEIYKVHQKTARHSS